MRHGLRLGLPSFRLSPTFTDTAGKVCEGSQSVIGAGPFPLLLFVIFARENVTSPEPWKWVPGKFGDGKNFRVPHGMHLVSPNKNFFPFGERSNFTSPKVFFRQLNDPRPVMKRETRDGRRAARRALGTCSGEPERGRKIERVRCVDGLVSRAHVMVIVFDTRRVPARVRGEVSAKRRDALRVNPSSSRRPRRRGVS